MFSFKYPIFLLVCALPPALWPAATNPGNSGLERPNILILSIDDLRPELGCYGASHMQTPHIDALAAESMRFKQAYVQQAVCLPSRISLFTGMRPNSTGVHDLQTDFRDTIPDALTMTQFFGQNGYTTIGMGKVYHDEKWGEWDEWIDTYNLPGINGYQAAETLAQIEAATKEARAQGLKGKAFRQFTKGPAYEWADAPESAYHDGAMTDLAIDKLKAHADEPFYMVVGYKKPHLPFVMPQKYWDLYPAETVSLPDNYFLPEGSPKIAHMTWGELRSYSGIPEKGELDTATALELIRGYYASVSFVDAQVGRLMETLEDEGLADNTIVVLWGDHGWKLGEHRMWCKHTNYEIDTRVPFLIKAPGERFVAGETDALVELLDLFPTLSDLSGLPVPEQCEGSSLVPLLENPDAAWDELAYSQYPRWGGIMGYSVKSHDGRYTEWLDEKSGQVKAREYYDHRIDPNENQNLANDSSFAAEIARLSAAIHSVVTPLVADPELADGADVIGAPKR